MPTACTSNSLAAAAKCFLGAPPLQLKAMQVALLCAIANGTSMECDPNSLATAAKCFTGLSSQQLDAISVMLLCEISTSGGGGGSSMTCGAYGGLEPSFTPSTTCAIATDSDAPNNVWIYVNGQWNFTGITLS